MTSDRSTVNRFQVTQFLKCGGRMPAPITSMRN
jgi:uncharacterized protein (UPF0210 family)